MWPASCDHEEDMNRICGAEYIPWDALKGKTIFITGATGLIGFTLVDALLYANQKKKIGLSIVALVRNEERAKERFAATVQEGGSLRMVVGTVEELPEIPFPIDFMIHGASQTASMAFIEKPAETIRTAVRGTENVLELAKSKQVEGFVYLSSMEVYGYPPKGHKVTENEIGALTPLALRNSYPISKQLCESLCCAYAGEYMVPAVILRLAQTFGPGVREGDSRIFAEFGRCVLEKRDIVLRTSGKTERSYLYTADAVTAILTVLLKGRSGQAYNAADGSTYCSITEMARRVAALGGVGVRYEIQDEEKQGYPPALYMDLDTTAIEKLGWKPFGGGIGLEAMYERMIKSW